MQMDPAMLIATAGMNITQTMLNTKSVYGMMSKVRDSCSAVTGPAYLD